MKKLVIFLPLFLTACNTTVIERPRLEEYRIPSELLDCGRKLPPVPKAETLKEKQVAKYITGLRKVINECKLDVRTIERLTIEYNELVKKFNEEISE